MPRQLAFTLATCLLFNSKPLQRCFSCHTGLTRSHWAWQLNATCAASFSFVLVSGLVFKECFCFSQRHLKPEVQAWQQDNWILF